MTTAPDQEAEYVVDSQWAGWWGGYGAERLLANEINNRARDGWKLKDIETSTKMWFGLSLWPLALWALRTKVLYVFERPKR